MTLTFDQIKSVTVGATVIEETEKGIRFGKFSDTEAKKLAALDPGYRSNGEATCGVRLDFHTDSSRIAITAPVGGKFEILIDGLLELVTSDTRNLDEPITLELDGLEHRITVALPSHLVSAMISRVELDDGSSFSPHRFAHRFLFYGDSITQGWDSRIDTASYAWRISLAFDADSIIRGVGGAFYHPDMFAEADNDPDTVFIAYGVNDQLRSTPAEVFRSLVCAFLDKIYARYADRRVYVITPIWCGMTEGKAMTMDETRKIITEEAEARGFTAINGRSLMPPLREMMADEWLHPNAAGFSYYAENLARIIEHDIRT